MLPAKKRQRMGASSQFGRVWTDFEPQEGGFNTLGKLKVMSYNILADNLLFKNRYLYGRDTPADYLRWPSRWNRIFSHIEKYIPDVICLQEVQYKHLELDIAPDLSRKGYQYHFVRRTSFNEDHEDGVAIFYRCDRLVFIEKQEVFYNCNTIMNRDNVGIVIKFRWKAEEAGASALFLISNTHILFNPKRGVIKAGQIHMLLSHCFSVLLQGSYHSDALNSGSVYGIPIVICADMNSSPESDINKFVVSGEIDLTQDERGLSGGNIKSSSMKLSKLPPDKVNEWNSGNGINASKRTKLLPVEENIRGSLSHPFKLKSVYSRDFAQNRVSMCHSRGQGLVDAIYYGNLEKSILDSLPQSWNVPLGEVQCNIPTLAREKLNKNDCFVQFRPRRILQLPAKDNCPPCPNEHEGSDHLPLLVDFDVILVDP